MHDHLSGLDRLIAGQDGPNVGEAIKSSKAYNSVAYDNLFIAYLNSIQDKAGIFADVKKAWSYKHKMDSSMHYFEVTALQTMVCKRYNSYVVQAGIVYMMFPSWKRGENKVHEITMDWDLDIKTLEKAPSSGMRQYLILPKH
ncbi:4-dimethylallyltryptophan n-methyltransferase [Fusarium longipes]|uniref:4-dimethylallyltryptophan n-methyltransferase n=1 Tax=Fusarium longipes TaxID=694270 RepID=A0A395SFH6_9HYPO|nr:4-dimethylallyltryptophan n-methyltransferase [Fusarium longipes]